MKIYKGIDISLYQGTPDFGRVKKSGIDFVMIKSSQGKTPNVSSTPFIDPCFHQNVMNLAHTKGKIYGGAYHYLTSQTIEEAKQEAQFFIDTIKRYKYNLQLWKVIDVEIPNVTADRKTFTEIIKTFCDMLKNADFQPMIYTQKWYINAYFDVPNGTPLWICDINTSKFPEGAKMWQCGTGIVAGIDGEVDINYAIDIMGDVNNDGKINNKDVTLMMKHIINPSKYPINETQGDFNRDGKITASDVVDLMRAISV